MDGADEQIVQPFIHKLYKLYSPQNTSIIIKIVREITNLTN